MKVRVLGCSGAIARDCRTTSFLVNDRILIDAGTGVGDLTLDEMRCIDHVLLTHSHLDHIAALPLMLDSVASLRTQPLQLWALPETVDALRQHIFNNVIWPDFSQIPSAQAPFFQYQTLMVGQVLMVEGIDIEVLPAEHTVPAVGYALRGARGWWVFSGDTGRNAAFWQRVNQLQVSSLVIETAFSNRWQELALKSQHLSPDTLAQELACIDADSQYPIYITHTKPCESERIMQEIAELSPHIPSVMAGSHPVCWLAAGDVLMV